MRRHLSLEKDNLATTLEIYNSDLWTLATQASDATSRAIIKGMGIQGGDAEALAKAVKAMASELSVRVEAPRHQPLPTLRQLVMRDATSTFEVTLGDQVHVIEIQNSLLVRLLPELDAAKFNDAARAAGYWADREALSAIAAVYRRGASLTQLRAADRAVLIPGPIQHVHFSIARKTTFLRRIFPG